jgi:hypothetical protein
LLEYIKQEFTVMKAAILMIFVLTMNVSILNAKSSDCTYNGKVYPLGTKLGLYTCQPDGIRK